MGSSVLEPWAELVPVGLSPNRNWMASPPLMSNKPFPVFDSSDVAAQGGAPEITGFPAQQPNLVGNPINGPHGAWLNNTTAFQRLDPTANPGSLARKAEA